MHTCLFMCTCRFRTWHDICARCYKSVPSCRSAATRCFSRQHSVTTNYQDTETHCNKLQHIAAHCNTTQHTATHCNILQHIAAHCNTLLHTATHRNILQHTARHCSTLQHAAILCNAVPEYSNQYPQTKQPSRTTYVHLIL